MKKKKEKIKLYSRYPATSILIYNGTTIVHYALGGMGIILGYDFNWTGLPFGLLYIVFAFVQMYILMPYMVCSNCVYYKIKNALCISGLNLVSRKIAKEGNVKDFPKRGEGIFCHNHLYMASLFLPIIAMIPALIINFSLILLMLFMAVTGLLLYRFFVVFPKTACIHCRAKYDCPNAKAMGLSET